MVQKPWRTRRIDRRQLCYKGRPQGRPFALLSGAVAVKELSMPNLDPPTLSQSIVRGLACKCPRCGGGKLYAGYIRLRPRCETCDLDYAFTDAGDGPAVFIILIAGFIVVASALIVEVKYQPPFWLHAMMWVPLVLGLTFIPLRSMKSLLIALQFHHSAAEGRLVKREPE